MAVTAMMVIASCLGACLGVILGHLVIRLFEALEERAWRKASEDFAADDSLMTENVRETNTDDVKHGKTATKYIKTVDEISQNVKINQPPKD